MTIKKGDRVFMLKPNKDRHFKIIIGTVGECLAFRKEDDGEMAYLVKFEGHRGPRHCAHNEIIK